MTTGETQQLSRSLKWALERSNTEGTLITAEIKAALGSTTLAQYFALDEVGRTDQLENALGNLINAGTFKLVDLDELATQIYERIKRYEPKPAQFAAGTGGMHIEIEEIRTNVASNRTAWQQGITQQGTGVFATIARPEDLRLVAECAGGFGFMGGAGDERVMQRRAQFYTLLERSPDTARAFNMWTRKYQKREWGDLEQLIKAARNFPNLLGNGFPRIGMQLATIYNSNDLAGLLTGATNDVGRLGALGNMGIQIQSVGEKVTMGLTGTELRFDLEGVESCFAELLAAAKTPDGFNTIAIEDPETRAAMILSRATGEDYLNQIRAAIRFREALYGIAARPIGDDRAYRLALAQTFSELYEYLQLAEGVQLIGLEVRPQAGATFPQQHVAPSSGAGSTIKEQQSSRRWSISVYFSAGFNIQRS